VVARLTSSPESQGAQNVLGEGHTAMPYSDGNVGTHKKPVRALPLGSTNPEKGSKEGWERRHLSTSAELSQRVVKRV
jgi:hypothetical protein